MGLDVDHLDEGDGIEQTLTKHEAKWHKSCRLVFNTTKLERARKRAYSTDESPSSKRYCHQSQQKHQLGETNCFFCDQPSSTETLHEVSTFNVDERVRQCAFQLQDHLIAKLSSGDMIAQEARYHAKYLAALYNRCRAQRETEDGSIDCTSHGIAFAELITYIDEARVDDGIFKLADLARLYSMCLEQLGINISTRIHTTDLKNRILAHYPDLKAYTQGRDVLLAFDASIRIALKKFQEDSENDGMYLARAAKIVRQDILSHNSNSLFNGAFKKGCQESSMPPTLLSLVAMIQNGPNIKIQSKVYLYHKQLYL